MYRDKYLKYKAKYHNCKSVMTFIKSINLIQKSLKSFDLIDFAITNNEKQKIEFMNLNSQESFNYFGIYNYNKIKQMISKFIISLGNDECISNTISKLLIKKIISPFLKAMEKDSLWFTIRIQYSNNEYDIPRWHSDGYFYNWEELSQKNEVQLKLAGTLIGPGTLFKIDNNNMKNEYIRISTELHQKNKLRVDYDPKKRNREVEISSRKTIAESLKSYEEIQPKNDQVAIFSVGNQFKSTIHSEPQIDTKRLFFSIVAGNIEEIRDMSERWNKEFYGPT